MSFQRVQRVLRARFAALADVFGHILKHAALDVDTD